jgi:vancomycin permeability regulator SanA
VSPRARPLRWLLLACGSMGLLGLAALSGSVAFVRASAAGHIFAEADVPAAPVALVLGAQVNPDGSPSAFLAARLDLAKRLFDAGRVRVILVSGDNMAREYDEPTAMLSYLVTRGVPADKIVADYAGYDTYDSCSRARRIFGVNELIVVSQSYHVPRAVATAVRLGLRVSGVGDDSARRYARAWRSGALRDQFACVKTVIDLLTRRDPVLGPHENGVENALSR